MPKNMYFNFNKNPNEASLYSSLKKECIEIFGINMWYVPRNSYDENSALGEDIFQNFTNSYQLVMYPTSVASFGDQHEFMNKFGFTLNEKTSVILHKDEFITVTGLQQPQVGDVIYWQETKRLFQITFFDYDNIDFYNFDNNYVWKLDLELFKYTSEEIDTSESEINEFETLFNNNDTTDNQPMSDNTSFTTQGNALKSNE